MVTKEYDRGGADRQVAREILQKVLAGLKEAGLEAQILPKQPYAIGERRPDATIAIGAGDRRTRICVEIKPAVPATALGHVMAQVRESGPPMMLMTRYITPPMAGRLIERNIPFADTAGNVYVKLPGLFVHVAGRKLPRAETQPIRAFRPTGLQVIFALLCQPDLVKTPYRNIAEVADVALGTVEYVMNDLQRLNYLVNRADHGRKLTNVRNLLDTWVMTYAHQLRPKRFLGRFHGLNLRWWETADWRGLRAHLGGEPAAAQVTRHLKPERITAYLAGDLNEFLQRNRLTRDEAGETGLIRTFWHFPLDWPYPHLTPPLLIYADLLATANARNIETGKIIYDRYLAGQIPEKD